MAAMLAVILKNKLMRMLVKSAHIVESEIDPIFHHENHVKIHYHLGTHTRTQDSGKVSRFYSHGPLHAMIGCVGTPIG